MAFTLEIVDNSTLVGAELEAAVKKALMLCGETAKAYSKKLCPVDTGNLRNSIDYQVSESTMQIGTNVEYAEYVECGTVKQDAQPYLQPALAQNADKYTSIIKSTLGS